jgi:ubiquinone/menaquinone biosynthesis C-methylase UbiE
MAPNDYVAKSAYRGEVAARYDEQRRVETLWEQEQAFVQTWAESLAPGATVLDLPVGTGRFVDLLLARSLKVEAWDISEDMLAEVRKRPSAAHPHLTIAVGDAERIALPDRSVDYVLCWRLFHLVPLATIDRILAEFRRVCRQRIVIQVLPVRTGGLVAWAPPALKAVLRPVRRLLARRHATPWSHIPSFVHAERDLLKRFARHRLTVVEAVTLADYQGLPVRVYTLEDRA